MKKIYKKLLIAAAISGVILASILQFKTAEAQVQNNTWTVISNTLKPVLNSYGIQVPSLGSTGNPCIDIASTSGQFATTTCGSGGSATGGSPIGNGPFAPYLGFVSTGSRLNNSAYTSFHYTMDRMPMTATDNISALQLVYGNWSGGAEAGPGTPIAIVSSIEYPANNFTRVTWSGIASGTIQSGSTTLSDTITLATPIPQGAEFWVRTWSNGSTVYIDGGGGKDNDYNFSASPLADNTMTSGLGIMVPGPYQYTPLAILGTTTRPSVAILGDSRTAGQNQSADNNNAVGYATMFESYGTANLGIPGTYTGAVISNHTQRAKLFPYATDLVVAFGINDFNDGLSTSTFMSNLTTIAQYVSPKPAFVATVEPETTSTDNWKTLAGQTVSIHQDEVSWTNDFIRSQRVPGYTGYVDPDLTSESSIDSGKWAVNGTTGWMTADGIHANNIGARLNVANQPAFYLQGNSTPYLPITGGIVNGSLSIGSSQYIASSSIATGTLTVAATSTLTGLKLTNLASTFLAVDSSGNVIATTSTGGGGSGTVNSGLAGQVAFYNANGTAVSGTSTVFFNNGNVGIGSTTPGSLLSVGGNITASGTLTISGNGQFGQNTVADVMFPENVSFGGTYGSSTPGSANNLKWDMFNDGAGNRYGIGMSAGLMEYQAGVSGSHEFFVNQGTAAMIICGGFSCTSGNVGIGTTTPASKLTVAGTFTSTATSTLTGLKLTNLASTFLAVDSSGNVIATTSTGGSGTGNAAWTIGNGSIFNATSTDLVSIGTSTPYAKLSVLGTYGSTTPIFDVASTTSTTGATSSIFTVLPTGSVGINASNPYPMVSLQIKNDGGIGRGGNGNARNIVIQNPTTGGNEQSRLEMLNDVGTTTASGAALFYTSSNYGSGFNSTLGFWNYQNGSIVLATNNAERLRILGNGNVGIGTSTPGSLLTVAGTSLFTGAETNQSSLSVAGQTILATASSTGLTVTATSTLTGLNLTNLSSTILAVDSLGNVIATTTAGGGSSNSAWTIGSGVIYNATSTDNVAIGTTTAGSKLTIGGGSIQVDNNNGLYFLAAGGATNGSLILDSSNNFDLMAPSFGDTLVKMNGGKFQIQTINGNSTFANDGSVSIPGPFSTASTTGLSTFAGYLGIGSSTPGSILAISASSTLQNDFIAISNGASTLQMGYATGVNTPRFGTMSNIGLNLVTNNTSRLTISGTGNVGISTTTPADTLDVYGSVRLEASSTVITPSISGAIVGLGCDSATSSVDTSISSSTTAFITTPQNYPGDGLTWQTYLSATGVITTKVCSDVTVTPSASKYVVKIIR